VETTATPASTPTSAAKSVVGVESADFEVDSALADRMLRPKAVRILRMPVWPVPAKGSGRNAAIRLLANEAGALRERHGPTVGCFVNTVGLAVRLAEEIRSRGLVVELFCGRMRPHDVDQIRQRRPGLLSLAGNDEVDIIVATQTLEVGVDLDLSAALSELAPGAALAQRAGRVNRIGRREYGDVVVAVPEVELTDDDPCRPYQAADLNAACGWVNDRAADPAGLAPWALRTAPPPDQSPRRPLYQRVELADVWHWARTNDDIAAEPDLDLWLADDFEPDHDVGVLVRVGMPDDPNEAVELVRALPPRRHEVFPTSIGEARRALAALVDGPDDRPAVVRVRAGDPAVLDIADLRPGDLVVIDERSKLFRAGVVRADPEATECADDVLEARQEPGPGEVVLRVGASSRITDDDGPVTALLKEVADLLADGQPTRATRAQIGELLDHLAGQLTGSPLGMLPAAAALLRPGARVTDCDVLLQRSASDGSPLRLLIIDTRRATSDEEVRQAWSTANRVPLSKHSAAVADRAAALADTLELGDDLVEVLRLAGRHHDAGKVDPRFQRMLGADAEAAEPLAKSGMTSISQVRAAYGACGLPPGWRHEQLSVVSCWPQLAGLPAGRRQLVARLVGTSHGHGRHGFPHSAGELLDTGSLAARDLFDEGGWDQLIEQTHRQWGVWGCAYLEAVLRAADGQVSMEGS
jgi:CRISPR-associated endonuclease/helicase Cas3